MNLDLKNQVPLDSTFSYLKVTDGVYRILVDRQYCNTELIIGSEKAAVIDTGFGFGDLPAAVRKLTEKPLLLFNTHCHVDHVGGNAPFGLPVHMGREDIEAARKSNYAAFRVHSWDDRIARLGPESVAGMDREEYLNRGAGELVPCEEGERFDLGGRPFSRGPGLLPGGEENPLYRRRGFRLHPLFRPGFRRKEKVYRRAEEAGRPALRADPERALYRAL